VLQTVWAEVRRGQIELLEDVHLAEGSKVLVTVIPEDEASFWMDASQSSLAAIWDNAENDVCAQLLKR
jgi:hypothetical protein